MAPIRFVFGLHLHQPVGNFDHVFAQHVEDVYRPLLDRLAGRGFLPVALHLSGPLLEWLERHEPAYLDRLGVLAADGKVEMLLAGFYEPVLAALPRADRVEQIGWMHEAVRRRFGVDARGLWLTERVWEPELAADLAEAGVRYALVDDRHFLATGFPAERLHAPFWTESDGRSARPRRPRPTSTGWARRGIASPSWPTTGRSSAAGPAPRSGSTSRAGSTGSST
jgi:alpha-amylase/alpha-mannosidase (GH57 family)